MPITPELTQYVAESRKSGASDDAIRQELLKAGWNPVDVSAVLAPPAPVMPIPILQPAFKQEQPVMQTVQVRPRKSRLLLFVLIFALLLSIAGAVYYFLPQITDMVMKLTGNEAADTSTLDSTGVIDTKVACTSLGSEVQKNRCYEELAIKDSDVTICSEIMTPSTFDHCVIGVAGPTKNIDLCTQVKSDSTRNICYGSVAYHTLDLSLCDRIIEPHPYPYAGVKDLCYVNIARELKDVSICEKIIIPTEQDEELGPLPPNFQGGRVSCYQQVAKALNDKTICEKILASSEKTACINDLQDSSQATSTEP